MHIVLALGNPGKEYEKTRHNAGWIALEHAFPELEWSYEKKFEAQISELHIGNEIVVFAKPETFMNESGKTALALKKYYDVSAEHISVVYDDVDVPLGRIEISHSKGDGGHNGIGSVIDRLATRHFTRIRIGIGKQVEIDGFGKKVQIDSTKQVGVSNEMEEKEISHKKEALEKKNNIPRRAYVLAKFSPDEYEVIKNISNDLRQRIEWIAQHGRDSAMNEFN